METKFYHEVSGFNFSHPAVSLVKIKIQERRSSSNKMYLIERRSNMKIAIKLVMIKA